MNEPQRPMSTMEDAEFLERFDPTWLCFVCDDLVCARYPYCPDCGNIKGTDPEQVTP